MFSQLGEQAKQFGEDLYGAAADCTRQYVRATRRLIRLEPTKALVVAASLGALAEVGIYAFQHRSRPVLAPPLSRWQRTVARLRPKAKPKTLWSRLVG